MDENGRPQGENLAEAAREQNSNLRRLIDGIGALIATSRELLGRLQSVGETKTEVEDHSDHLDAGNPSEESRHSKRDEN